MNKKRGLGKGLGALLPPVKSSEENIYKEIDIEAAQPNSEQPRQIFDEDKLEELAESIKEHGIVQPIVVRPLAENKYEIIAGERRWRACKRLGMKVIPALIKYYGDLEATAVALIENVQRENLSPLEEAGAYRRLMKEFNLTQEEVSKRVGKSRPFVGNMVRLLSLSPGVREMVNKGEITAGHARALLSIEDEGRQLAVAQKIVQKQLNVRQAEEMAAARQLGQGNIVRGGMPVTRSQKKRMEKEMASVLSAKVKIRFEAGGQGKVAIMFSNMEELNSVMNAIAGKKVNSRE